MKRESNLHATAGALIGAAFLGVAAQAAPPRYIVTDLETLGGGQVTSSPGSAGYALTDAGAVVGSTVIGDGEEPLRAFFWDGSMLELPPTSFRTHTTAFSCNNAGEAVGIAYDLGELVMHAVLWQAGQPMHLGDFAPRDVNAQGVMAGRKQVLSHHSAFHAVRWEEGSIVDLGTLGGSNSEALALDAGGRIVGASLLADNLTMRAFLWQGGPLLDLGTLGGDSSQAYDISDAGSVVGVADTAIGARHAFLFRIDQSGNVTQRLDLGELGGGWSYAYAVNELDEVVGTSASRAFIHRDGVMRDLNDMIRDDLGWRLHRATGINEAGQVTGNGMHNGLPRAFLLTPVSPGDLNGDGQVNQSDLGILLSCYELTDCGDVDGDGDTDQSDLGLLLANYERGA